MKKTITICSSGSFYREVVELEDQLKMLGFKVLIPSTASKMKRENDFNIDKHKAAYKEHGKYSIKRKLMREHFKKILAADAVLIYNKDKNGTKGYIGGNVLLEMFVAYQNKIPIFVWEKTDNSSILLEEILCFEPVFINQNIFKIKVRVRKQAHAKSV